MKSNTIHLLCLLLIHTVIANDIKGGMFMRWIGSEKQYAEHLTPLSWEQKDFVYYDVDLYPYQHFLAQCPTLGKGRPGILSPLDKGEYYTAVSSDGSPSNLKMSRETKKLKDDFPELKVISTEEDHVFYYTAPGKHKKIETIYFECIISIAVPDVTAIIQLNIMPEGKYLPKEEHLVLDELPVPKGKTFIYFKFARPGVKTVTECKNSELVLNDGRGVSVKKPEAKAYTNPVTLIEYQDVSEYIIKHTATKNTHIIDLMDGRVINIKKGDLVIHCKNEPENQLVYMPPHIESISGLNSQISEIAEFGGSTKIIRIKTEDNPVALVDVSETMDVIFPEDCLHEVFTATGEIVKMSEIVRNPKLVRMTDSLKILDLSTSSSYRAITVSCATIVEEEYEEPKNVWMDITISPLCNFYDPLALDSDGKTCTIFSSSHVDSLVATPMDSLESPETFEMEEAFFTKSDDPKGTCEDCTYKKIVEREGDISLLITKGMDNQKIMITDGVIRHNPVYILNKEEVKGGNEVLNPTNIIRMYLHNHEVDIDEHGNVSVEDKFKVKSDGNSAFYRAHIDGHYTVKISCKDFFEDSGSSEPILFPNGKNTIFENVSDGAVDPRTIKTIQFEQEFASMGISILKKPETDVDLQLIFDEDKLVQNKHVKPIYFICSTDVQGDWEKDKRPYAVIAIDPGYETEKLKGCGVKSGVFVDENGRAVNDTHCTYNVYKNDIVGFHCPSYVPEHFLEGDQTQYKADERGRAKNPYRMLMRCYDRSSIIQKIVRLKASLRLFPRPEFAGELRSLWIFDRNTFAGNDLTNILCVCYDKTGTAISSIRVKNQTHSVGF